MAFTTYASLLQEMLDDFQSGAWKVKSYTIGSRTVNKPSLPEWLEAIRELRALVQVESASAGTISRRTYAKNGNGGCGRW